MTSRVVLLGGSGFIGTRLASLLESERRPFVIGDIRPSTRFPDAFVHCDVRSIAEVKGLLMPNDIIVNLAAVHRDDVRPTTAYYETNVGGADAVCRAATEALIRRQVFVSSVSVYGDSQHMASESTEQRPTSHYGKSKLESEAVYLAWSQVDATNRLCVVRPSVVFGEGNRGNVFNLLSASCGRRFIQVGDAAARKSISYVGNVAAALLWCADLPDSYVALNYADSPLLSVRELVQTARVALGLSEHPTLTLPRSAALCAAAVFDALRSAGVNVSRVSTARLRKLTTDSIIDSSAFFARGFVAPFDLRSAISATVRAEFAR